MEGFLQSLKFKHVAMQEYVCTLVGYNAKQHGYNKNWWTRQVLHWQGKEYKRKSQAYQLLLDRAYSAMFSQNTKAAAALVATGTAVLTHSIGKNKKNETILTEQEFCSRLMGMRDLINK